MSEHSKVSDHVEETEIKEPDTLAQVLSAADEMRAAQAARPVEEVMAENEELRKINTDLRTEVRRYELQHDLLKSQSAALSNELSVTRQRQVQASAFIAHNQPLASAAARSADAGAHLGLSHNTLGATRTMGGSAAPVSATPRSARVYRPVTAGAGNAPSQTIAAEMRRLSRELENARSSFALAEQRLTADVEAARADARKWQEKVREMRTEQRRRTINTNNVARSTVQSKDDEIRELREQLRQQRRATAESEAAMRTKHREEVASLRSEVFHVQQWIDQAAAAATRDPGYVPGATLASPGAGATLGATARPGSRAAATRLHAAEERIETLEVKLAEAQDCIVEMEAALMEARADAGAGGLPGGLEQELEQEQEQEPLEMAELDYVAAAVEEVVVEEAQAEASPEAVPEPEPEAEAEAEAEVEAEAEAVPEAEAEAEPELDTEPEIHPVSAAASTVFEAVTGTAAEHAAEHVPSGDKWDAMDDVAVAAELGMRLESLQRRAERSGVTIREYARYKSEQRAKRAAKNA